MRILASDGMEKNAVAALRAQGHEVVEQFYEPAELAEQVKNFDVLVVRSATKVRVPIIDAACETGKLKLIIRGGVGIDNIDHKYAEEKGIKVMNTPRASSDAVAELAMAHMLSCARFISVAGHTMREGKWEKKAYKGIEIHGKTLGIVGFGRIGQALGRMAKGMGMNVIAFDIFHIPGIEEQTGINYVEMDELLAKSDFISVHAPAVDGGAIINAANIAKMKDGVRVLNYARGELVNDEDMIAALESGKVAYYCTDFPNAKTCNAKHIIATPHLGASTPESEDNCASMAADELMAYLEQGDIRNSVNLPNAQLQAVYTKVCVIHRNVPAMISALTSVIGEAGANIENMTNASKKDYAYTILDIDGVTDGMIEALTAIDGVLRVRVIEK